MGSGVSPYLANLFLNQVFLGLSPELPTTGYVALGTGGVNGTGPGFSDSTTNNELPSGFNYGRQTATFSNSVFNVPSLGATSNITTFNYGNATNNFGLVTQFAIFDAVTSGNLLVWSDLLATQLVTTGNPMAFAGGNPGSMVIQFQNGVTNTLSNLLLNLLFLGITGSFPSTIYVGLGTGGFTDSTQTGELFGGQYGRQSLPVTMGSGSFNTPSGGSTSNIPTINYGTASANHGLVAQWGIFDATTSGNLLAWANLLFAQTVVPNNTYSFAGGAPGSLVYGMV